ncbi:MAG: CBS domain-containing protein [Betaproteobacteria bacterium]|nr:CBS domain-containing protein [Betaproteobacteria bacterium]MDH5222839.1 CBS domain-containing protein [Betaproteobacteria bacterium]MDH5350036.1 CBS domain-containing protein [Betaproteobacteria bacterium]
MADAERLSHAFMRAHPAQAARVLEAVVPAEAAALLARVPARLGAPVLAAMLPNAAARALSGLQDEHSLALLGELATQPVVAVMRHVPEPRRARLIAGLPTAAALASQLLLGYPEDAIGAWTDPDVLALPGTTRAAEALERVRHMEGIVQRVFVTSGDRRLEGWVPLPALLRASAGAALTSIMSRPEGVLTAQTPLAGAVGHPGWERSSLLPVVESGGRLVGVLTRDALARASRRVSRPAHTAAVGSLASMLTRSYWDALSGGAEAMATLLPTVGPVGSERDER